MQHCLRSCKIQGKQEQTMCIFVQWFLSAVVSCGLSFPADKAAGHLAILGLHWGSRGWLWGIASGLPVTESCSRGSKGDRVWARTSSHFYRTCLAPHTHTYTYIHCLCLFWASNHFLHLLTHAIKDCHKTFVEKATSIMTFLNFLLLN